jgi:DNA-binding LacI/PurR family transcriptional regulator
MICGTDDGLEFTAPLDRRVGYERVLASLGMPCVAESVVVAPWGFEGGARAMEQLLASPELPTAIFAESDEMAFGALRTLRRAGLRVPEDISLVGFDDHEFASVVDLTTVAQPVHDIGEIAATLLLEAIGPRAGDVTDVTLPTRLVVRGTTGPPPHRRVGR